MAQNLVFILEDEPSDRAVLEQRITDVGLTPIS